jgi:hypothetical protein
MLTKLAHRLEVRSRYLADGLLIMSLTPKLPLRLLVALVLSLCGGSVGAQSAAAPFQFRDYTSRSGDALRQLAAQGDANARYELARRLYLGATLPQDVMTADILFQQAAEAGHPEAQLKLGLQAERAIGRPLDYEAALKWYRLSAQQGNPVAQHKLGRLYDHGSEPVTRRVGPNSYFTGSGVTNDLNQARSWYSLGAKQNYGPSLYRLFLLEQGPRHPGALSPIPAGALLHLEKAVESGVPEAFSSMAARHTTLFGGSENLVEAYRWASLAKVSFGSTEFSLLPMLERKMTPDQIAQAKKLAAATKTPAASPAVLRWHELIHLQNPGPSSLAPPGSQADFRQLETAASQGQAQACFQLALCLQHDSYLERENDRHHNLYRGDKGPAGLPGGAVSFDFSQTRDGRAAKWFEQAADRGHRDAQYHLAWLYLAGRGVTGDKLKARQRFEQAAAQNHIQAKYELALLMEQEIGGPKVMTDIIRLLREAADAGHTEAAHKLVAWQSAALTAPVTAGGMTLPGDTTGSPARPHPRLAILALASELAPYADLLVSGLSGQTGVELVDRQEIDKVLQEQALTAQKPGDLARLGRLLRADGFALLSALPSSTEPTSFQVRLLAVGPGATVGQWVHSLPLAEPVQWSDLCGKQLAPYLPKLVVPPQNAVPLSILNLRSGISSRQTEEQERQLTFLLLHRLLRVPELFIMERQRLERLAEEKQLAGVGNEPFWNGSYLLDGIINRDGEVPGKITLHARLISRRQQTNEIFVSGMTADLPAVIEQLAGKLAPLLHQKQAAKAWNPVEEAAYYYEEARWAMRWNMFTEAQQASEASWALGLRLPELLQLRVTAYERAAETSTGMRSYQNGKLVRIENLPGVEKLEALNRALEIYLAAASQTNRQAWMILGTELLKRSQVALEHFYLSPTSWPAATEQLAIARKRSRELAAWLLTAAPDLPRNRQEICYGLLLSQGALWEENPSEALKALEQRLDQGLMGKYLRASSQYGLMVGQICDWSRSPTENHDALRNKLLEKRIAGGPVDQQMESCLAGIMFAASREDLLRWAEQLVDLYLRHEPSLIRGGLDDIYWRAANDYLQNGRYAFGSFNTYQMSAPRMERWQEKVQRLKTALAARKAAAEEAGAITRSKPAPAP